MSERMKKYLDLSKLDKDKIEALKSLIGEELFVQRGRCRFQKTDDIVYGAVNIVSRDGRMYYVKFEDLPKYLLRDKILSLR